MIYITTRNLGEAKRIARTLVEKRLAACVNVFPITSIYHWDGIQEDAEVALIVKTTRGNVKKIEECVKELHSYEMPCIISFAIDGGSEEFLKWVRDEMK
ncbi:MAG: divalent-cation tolerance protein CutA [Methanosarcinales archaeon Met12]|nr:MAG: divalent-cation tolerance protein CutA [Methanosarcinales archaeon Met12]